MFATLAVKCYKLGKIHHPRLTISILKHGGLVSCCWGAFIEIWRLVSVDKKLGILDVFLAALPFHDVSD